VTEDEVTTESIQAEFRGWEAFQGVDRRWHARLRGTETPVMVHGEDLIDLRDQIRRAVPRPKSGPGSGSTSRREATPDE
jgi:hypothetical protein